MQKYIQKIVNLTLFTAVLIGSVALANSDENKKVSCEILSCLNSEQRPSKCIRSLKYFYSIKGKKLGETLTKRKEFLKLCPTDSGDTPIDAIMADYKGMLDRINPDKCKPEYLNNQLQNINQNTNIKYYKNNDLKNKTIKDKFTRINPNMPKHCSTLVQSDKMPKYNCNDSYYTLDGFKRGYELITITKEEYEKLNSNDRHHETKSYSYECGGKNFKTCYVTEDYYYQKTIIPKTCWSY
ncbi:MULTISPECIES: TrbM/KikA/MpfK family conjugal transfer protein [Campylobacter]|uniref:TrbM/KikA/MpfK family conjugal transfer protein n=1 Tax=Campylobacter TaxID=194 RepID=UPI000A341B58|nr:MULTISPECIES: TrbM/KikA/MpfK family conjugal transfer protein [unclassified Campylobacter]MBE6429910.1 hypothetical protein [Campylobacter sp.]